jgi:hypothetical protein
MGVLKASSTARSTGLNEEFEIYCTKFVDEEKKAEEEDEEEEEEEEKFESPFKRGSSIAKFSPADQRRIFAEGFQTEDEDDENGEAGEVSAPSPEKKKKKRQKQQGRVEQPRRHISVADSDDSDDEVDGGAGFHMNGSSSEEEDEDPGDLERRVAISRPPAKRTKLDWSSSDALKLRCSTSDIEQIASTKKALCADDSTWVKGGTSTAKKGNHTTTTEWRCSFRKRLRCNAILREELPGDVDNVTELKMVRQHEHDFGGDTSACLPIKVKNLLAPFVGQTGARCSAMFAALERGGVNIVTDFKATKEHKEQVMSFVRRERVRTKEARWSGTFGALSSFKEEHEVPYSEITAKFSGKADDTDGMHTFIVTEDSVIDAGKKIIHLTGTTAHLSRNNERDSKMRLGVQKCADGTFRLNWNGIPLIVVGVIDMGQHFHMTAWQLAYSEDKVALNSILASDILMADAVAEEDGFSLEEEVEHSMNDNNDASFDAVRNVLLNVKEPGNCAVHMHRNQKKKQYNNKERNCKPFLDDLKFISKTTISGGLAELLIDKVREKFEEEEPEIIRVWLKEYTGPTKGNWQFSKFGPAKVNHNNALEAFNNAIKEDGTMRELLPAEQFLEKMVKFTEQRSKMDVEFATEVSIGLQDWRMAQIVAETEGYFELTGAARGYTIILATEVYAQLANLHKGKDKNGFKKALKKAALPKMKEYSRFATKPEDKEFSEEIKAYSFDKLRKSVSECYHLFKLSKVSRKFGPLIMWQCSCPQFWHYGKCKHSLGYAIYKKEVAVPAKYNIAKIGLARKPGRPANATGGEALNRP